MRILDNPHSEAWLKVQEPIVFGSTAQLERAVE